MLERLVEAWLDSASERSYQMPFCQMLLAEGHTIVHSTRHSPIEFGKDVISIDANGKPCAFQLKGNPGGRLTLKQLREIQPQLIQLVTQPIVHPGVPLNQRHQCYLVTNGEIDEEAQRAVDDLNRSFKLQRFGANRLKLWSRGKLLKMAVALGADLWPSEIGDLNALLQLLVHEGNDFFPIDKFHRLLEKIFALAPTDPALKKSELKRCVTSAALLTATALKSFANQENHTAIIYAWTTYASYCLAAAERCRSSFVVVRDSIDIAKTTIRDALASLCSELTRNPHLKTPGLEVGAIYQGRATLVYALMSLYWLWSEKVGWLVAGHKEFLEGWIPSDATNTFLWGEACVPQLLLRYWYLSRTNATLAPENLLASTLKALISGHLQPSTPPLASPYYSFEDAMRHLLAPMMPTDDPLEEETVRGLSYFAEGVLHLLVRSNLKRTCINLWPDLTRLQFCRFEPEKPWQYPLWRSARGSPIGVQPPLTKQWDALVGEARECSARGVPRELLRDEFFYALFLVIFPHRGTADAVRFLDRKLGTIWLIDPPKTNKSRKS